MTRYKCNYHIIYVSKTSSVFCFIFRIFYSFVGIAIKNVYGTFAAPSDLPVIDLRTLSSQFAIIATKSGVKLVVANITTTTFFMRYSLGLSLYLDQIVSSNSTSSVLSVVKDFISNSECLFVSISII